MKAGAIIFSTLIIIACVFSCKKKTVEPDPIVPDDTLKVPNPNAYYGELKAEKTAWFTNGLLTNDVGINFAIFSSKPFVSGGISSGTSIYAGAVAINELFLKKLNSPIVYYSDSTNTSFSPAHNWSVGGNGVLGVAAVPTFSYSNTYPIPSYTGYATLPATMSVNQSNTITLNGVTGADEIKIVISGSSGSASKTVNANDSIVVFSLSDLSSVPTTTNGTVEVECFKYNYRIFGYKTYRFVTGYKVQKRQVVLN